MTYEPTRNEKIAIWRHCRDMQTKAAQETYSAFVAAFPVGSAVAWKKGHHVHRGKVVDTTLNWWHLSLRVQNDKTQKVISITDYDIINFIVDEDSN